MLEESKFKTKTLGVMWRKMWRGQRAKGGAEGRQHIKGSRAESDCKGFWEKQPESQERGAHESQEKRMGKKEELGTSSGSTQPGQESKGFKACAAPFPFSDQPRPQSKAMAVPGVCPQPPARARPASETHIWTPSPSGAPGEEPRGHREVMLPKRGGSRPSAVRPGQVSSSPVRRG